MVRMPVRFAFDSIYFVKMEVFVMVVHVYIGYI